MHDPVVEASAEDVNFGARLFFGGSGHMGCLYRSAEARGALGLPPTATSWRIINSLIVLRSLNAPPRHQLEAKR